MEVTLYHNGFKIELFDDQNFTESADNIISYDKVYQDEKDKECRPISQQGIFIFENEIKIASAILLANGGGTTATKDSVIIHENSLITRCCNKVFSLTFPDLQLNWIVQADWATCFSIHKYQDGFISYGEMAIARIDKNGKILWEYGGADIFVSADGSSSFDMNEDHIKLKDFNGNTYKIDYNGKTISYNKSSYHKQEPVTVIMKSHKPWWKFW